MASYQTTEQHTLTLLFKLVHYHQQMVNPVIFVHFEKVFDSVGRCRSSYKVFSDLLKKQYTKQQREETFIN